MAASKSAGVVMGNLAFFSAPSIRSTLFLSSSPGTGRAHTGWQQHHATAYEDFVWESPSRTTRDIELYLLDQGDSRLAARETSCRQDIASDVCFAAAMLAPV